MTEAMVVRDFDLHCHVDLFPDPEAIIASCNKHKIITLAVTTTPKAWPQNERWTSKSQYVYAAVGLHPELAGERHGEFPLLKKYMDKTPFIGEVGLDGSPQHQLSWKTQMDLFISILSHAQQLGHRVISIHSRRAVREVLRCIKEHTTPDHVLPILHWFSDSISLAQQAVDLGCYFSINHRMLDSVSGIELVRRIPTDRLLLETDAPFTSIKGRHSEPIDVVTTVIHLANLRNENINDLRSALRENISCLFTFAELPLKISDN